MKPDWARIRSELDGFGCAVVPGLLTPAECAQYAASYASPQLFRSRVVMARHGFGRGQYQYFAYPLPCALEELRGALYPPLAAIANRWHDAPGIDTRFPARHDEFIARCHAAGQLRPTPLLLQYREGDYNCLHQDLYGARGPYRVTMRHGVSRLRSGLRHSLGIIFHDAR
jgi:hypothetical protein